MNNRINGYTRRNGDNTDSEYGGCVSRTIHAAVPLQQDIQSKRWH